jgi:hypothetical protein
MVRLRSFALIGLISSGLLLPGVLPAWAQQPAPFRPPAVPLVTVDPYFSVWSASDRLTDTWSKHWTGANHAMAGLVRIDGKAYRFLGPTPSSVPVMTQVSLEVFPTRTIYEFEAAGIRLSLTFMTPLLPDDLEVYTRPVTYLTWNARATDGQSHHVTLYFDCSAEWVVNTAADPVVWSRHKLGNLRVLSFASQHQPVLEKAGDNVRIDWGRFYVVAPPDSATAEVVATQAARRAFAETGKLPDSDELRMPRAASDEWPVLAHLFDFGAVGAAPVARYLVLAYDDVFSVEYFYRKLRPYWRRPGREADWLLRAAIDAYEALVARCRAFDEELMADLRRAGGEQYARLAALAYRQAAAAHKLVRDFDGTPLLFAKENFSGGFIGTVDVTYPSSPFFLLFNPQLLKAQLTPIFEYVRSGRWPFPYAPHDLGLYPKANGQAYGGGEKTEENQMPVEESGNMLLMVAALARVEGHADYARKYWPMLSQWARYLREKGMDPENQLCTDDFAGHLAHNANLSLKAILALGAYAMLAEMTGEPDEAKTYRQIAQEMAARWPQMAADGEHYRLAFDKPGTWSQKYNLVWDRLLGLNLFPSQIARQEIAFYLKKQNRYGLPLDNRETYTKLDWVVWTATLAEASQDFEALVAPAYLFAHESPSRVPLTDWYGTLDAKQRAFQARSVVGGVYIKLLADPALWKKWSSRACGEQPARH